MMSMAVFVREANREQQGTGKKASPPPPSPSSHAASRRKILRCDHCTSENIAVCLIESRFLCGNHFVAHCYRRLADYENTSEWRANPDPARRFFRECAAQATKLSLTRQELGNIDRARLLDIVLWANDLFGRPVLKRQSISANAVNLHKEKLS